MTNLRKSAKGVASPSRQCKLAQHRELLASARLAH